LAAGFRRWVEGPRCVSKRVEVGMTLKCNKEAFVDPDSISKIPSRSEETNL
jgi:hypothetical protein